MRKRKINILHLYSRELNIYGDHGNIATLVKRLEWRGFEPVILKQGVGEKSQIKNADIIFGGGGQDRGQIAVGKDLQRHAEALQHASDAGVPMLVICGTYQLFGRGFTTLEGVDIPGIGLFGAHTMGSTQRMIGNVVIESAFGRIVGFENHSGRTILDSDQKALGEVVKGGGNDGSSGKEGAIKNNTLGTYLHGPVLPKNPALADFLITTALKNKYSIANLYGLDDALEQQAAADSARRPR
jgi:CobQ-like glutamine amidotransferase family enzyme